MESRRATKGDAVDKLIEDFWDLVNAADELGRHLARTLGLHRADADAVVEILRAERRDEALAPVHLAGRIGLTSGATSLLLNRLEEAGYVERRRGHADRRRVSLHLTDAVYEPLKTFQDPVREDFERVLATYTSSELELFARLLHDLRGAVEDHHRRYR